MKKLLLSALGATLLFSACKKNDDDNSNTTKAKVMFTNAALDVDSLRARVNTNNIQTIAFLGSTGYVNVDATSSATIDFVYTGSGSVFQSKTTSLVAGNAYSAFAGGDLNTKAVIVTADDLKAPASGMAKIRFVNLSPTNLNAIAYVGTATVDSNIAFGSVTSFKEVAAGTQTITVVGVSPASANLSGQTLTAGKIYTFVFSGTFGGSGNAALKLTPITNN
ncbi:MAG TPA: DUF4397 domain-containing protein [Flavipsychrobacter sp.]|jgi:hypothetical protein|nr:DUF4397 domain-containing protein [Flavipsychrobacter sp.]